MKNIYEKLISHFEGVKDLEKQYSDLEKSISKIANKYNLHCKKLCGKCCLGAAKNKEASTFELLPMAINIEKNGLAEKYLDKLEHYEDCREEQCICFFCDDEEKGLGHCLNYEYRPFVCRLFGDSLYFLHDDKEVDFTGCHWLREEYKSNSNREYLHKKLPIISETVFRGRSLNEISFETITDINSALKEALQLVEMKKKLLEEETVAED